MIMVVLKNNLWIYPDFLKGNSVMNPHNNDDDIVYVPIPRPLLPAFYRIFPTILEEATKQETVAEPVPTSIPDVERHNLHVIDLSIKVAHEIGADRHSISLADLHEAYIHANPGIGKGRTRNSFDATINFHTINMRARFPDPDNKKKYAPWLAKPAFKRVSRGRYMLLSPNEIALFHLRIEESDPRIYEDEYNVEDVL
jgi:hypothetical protein